MKCSHVAFNLVLMLALPVPLLLEAARPLVTGDQDDENLPVLSTATAEETTQVMVDYLELKGTRSGSEEGSETSPGSSPDAGLHRPARSPPSPQGRYPPQHQQKPSGGAGTGMAGGRRPSAPPAPRGRNPPHWVRSSDWPARSPGPSQEGPWPLEVKRAGRADKLRGTD
uniref:Uncharacterized protein n=1 Tax=Oryza brachyantha TaxID=4533 RepID=J3L378_ORYBR